MNSSTYHSQRGAGFQLHPSVCEASDTGTDAVCIFRERQPRTATSMSALARMVQQHHHDTSLVLP